MNQDQFLSMFPNFIKESPALTNVRAQRYGCFGFDIVPGEREQYDLFCKEMEESGFIRHTRCDNLKDIFFNTTYFKDDYVVMISHITVHHKIWVYGYPKTLHTSILAMGAFENVPAMKHMEAARHYGADSFVSVACNVDMQDYKDYLCALEKAGFLKYVVNEEGLGGTVFSATYTKDEKVVTVTYFAKTGKATISVCPNLPLSNHLLKQDLSDIKHNVQTKLHMLKLSQMGNSFVIQLKNGHFIISDGGTWDDTEYLLEYMESLVPQGEKPIVEAWVLSHAHSDHVGALYSIPDIKGRAERICVEGVYFSEPNDDVIALFPICAAEVIYTKEAIKELRTSEGEITPIYRPQTGQRYYFYDVTMDIVHSQEHLPIEEYSGDINDSSTWVMFTIEGQKCLFCGDGESGSQKAVMRHYDEAYLELDVFTLPHHGHHTRDEFTDYTTVKTVLATVKEQVPAHRMAQNERLKKKANEWLVWGDGTKVLTFPYKTGTYEVQESYD